MNHYRLLTRKINRSHHNCAYLLLLINYSWHERYIIHFFFRQLRLNLMNEFRLEKRYNFRYSLYFLPQQKEQLFSHARASENHWLISVPTRKFDIFHERKVRGRKKDSAFSGGKYVRSARYLHFHQKELQAQCMRTNEWLDKHLFICITHDRYVVIEIINYLPTTKR